MRYFVCAKCFNGGGTLINKGARKAPVYVHQDGKCFPLNEGIQHEIYSRIYSERYWRPLLNIGVDYPQEAE